MEKIYNGLYHLYWLAKYPWKVIKTIATLGWEYLERYYRYQVQLQDKPAMGSFVFELIIMMAIIAGLFFFLAPVMPGIAGVLIFVTCLVYWLYRSMLRTSRKRAAWVRK
jgi:ABC-type xylose transport system permease subunit